MCMYLFLLCIVFACEVCTVMVNNNNNNNYTCLYAGAAICLRTLLFALWVLNIQMFAL